MRRSILLVSVVASLLASCAGGDSEEADPSRNTTPEGSVEPSPSPSPGIDEQSLAMLEGTWTGDMVEPGAAADWSVKVTLEPCASDVLCGTMHWETEDWYHTGRPSTCDWTLAYAGMREPSFQMGDHSFTFDETGTSARGSVAEEMGSGSCGDNLLALTPLPDGITLGFEEYYSGRWGNDWGLLRRGSSG